MNSEAATTSIEMLTSTGHAERQAHVEALEAQEFTALASSRGRMRFWVSAECR